MKKILLLSLIAASFNSNAQTITADDLKWTIGNYWESKVYAETGVGLDLAAGTSKVWDLTTYTGGTIDTVKVLASSQGDVKVKSNLTGELDYQKLAGNYALAALLNIPVDNKTTGQAGLPHIQGGSWTGNASVTLLGQSVNIVGTVLASGSVKIPWGIYNALLVKEEITGSLNQTTYYWETTEHGRVAAFVATKGKIMVMETTNFTTSINNPKKSTSLSVYPNPASNLLSVKSDVKNAQIRIFNALGIEVMSVPFNNVEEQINISNLSSGLYIVQMSSELGIKTATVVIK